MGSCGFIRSRNSVVAYDPFGSLKHTVIESVYEKSLQQSGACLKPP